MYVCRKKCLLEFCLYLQLELIRPKDVSTCSYSSLNNLDENLIQISSQQRGQHNRQCVHFLQYRPYVLFSRSPAAFTQDRGLVLWEGVWFLSPVICKCELSAVSEPLGQLGAEYRILGKEQSIQSFSLRLVKSIHIPESKKDTRLTGVRSLQRR